MSPTFIPRRRPCKHCLANGPTGDPVSFRNEDALSRTSSIVIDAVNKRDYAVIQTVVLLAAAVFVFVTLAVDLLYGVLDPRLRVVNRGRPARRTSVAADVEEA